MLCTIVVAKCSRLRPLKACVRYHLLIRTDPTACTTTQLRLKWKCHHTTSCNCLGGAGGWVCGERRVGGVCAVGWRWRWGCRGRAKEEGKGEVRWGCPGESGAVRVEAGSGGCVLVGPVPEWAVRVRAGGVGPGGSGPRKSKADHRLRSPLTHFLVGQNEFGKCLKWAKVFKTVKKHKDQS